MNAKRTKGAGAALVIDVWSPKGGAGKTTFAMNMAGAFAGQGYKTLVIDRDGQNSSMAYAANAQRLGKELGFDVATSQLADYDVVIGDNAPHLDAPLQAPLVVMPVQLAFLDYAATKRGEAELKQQGKKVLIVPNRVELGSAEDSALLARDFAGKAFVKKRNPAYKYAAGRGVTIYTPRSGLADVRAARAEFDAVIESLMELVKGKAHA